MASRPAPRTQHTHDAAATVCTTLDPVGACPSKPAQWRRWAVAGACLGALLAACGDQATDAAKSRTTADYLMICRVGSEQALQEALRFAAVATETSTGLGVDLWQLGLPQTTDPENRVHKVASLPEAPFTDGTTWESFAHDVTLPPNAAVSQGAFDRVSLRATARSLRCAELNATRGATSVVATCALLEVEDGGFFEVGSTLVTTHSLVDVETWGDRLPPTLASRRSEEFCTP